MMKDIMREKREIEKLCGQVGAASILLYLLNNNKAILSDLIYDLKIPASTVSRCVTILSSLNCIKEERSEYNRRVFTLTSKGLKIAEKIKEIEKILEEKGEV